jgi:hypothetical protein
MKPEDAEDVWLTAVIQTPAYMDHGLVRERHLSQRARRVLKVVHDLYEAGWDRLELAQVQLPGVELRSIPARLQRPEAQVNVADAEAVIIAAWSKVAYADALRRAAAVSEQDGPDAAKAFLWNATSRIEAETTGVEWATAGQAVEGWLTDKGRLLEARLRLEDPNAVLQAGDLGCGIADLDPICGYWEPERMTLVQAYTGDGKSTLVLQVLDGLAKGGVPGAYLSLEDRLAIHGGRLVAMNLDEPDLPALLALDGHRGEDGHTARFGPEELEVVRSLLDQGLSLLPLRLIHRPEWRIDQVCAGIIDAGRGGARVIAVDYIQQLLDRDDNPAAVLEVFARRMKAAATSVGAHLILVSQIVRPDGSKRERDQLPPPTLFGAKGGSIETKAETVLAPFRRRKDMVRGFEPATILVLKVKDGPTGEIKVWWDTRRHIYVTKDQMDLAEGRWKQ